MKKMPNQITNNDFAMVINARYKAMTDTPYVISLRTARRGRQRKNAAVSRQEGAANCGGKKEGIWQ